MGHGKKRTSFHLRITHGSRNVKGGFTDRFTIQGDMKNDICASDAALLGFKVDGNHARYEAEKDGFGSDIVPAFSIF